MIELSFFKNKHILITGHTGFKGSWMSFILANAGADVTGYALEPPTAPSLFGLISLNERIRSVHGDIRDLDKLKAVFAEVKPEIVIHMAAQPIVRESYRLPVYTYETNVMGTVNILECIRQAGRVKSFLNVTTDKVYQNREWEWGYREDDVLGGYDPYSNSKSCSELVTQSYKASFLDGQGIAVSTARAGNVIGGGDFAKDRIIPDCIRAAFSGEPIIVRNPHSTRPYQHVLEPVTAYLTIVQEQYKNPKLQGYYNVGPDDSNCVCTGDLVTMFCEKWGGAEWENKYDGGPHEASFLKLDCSKIKQTFGWTPVWNISDALDRVVEWTKVYARQGNLQEVMNKQLHEFLEAS